MPEQSSRFPSSDEPRRRTPSRKGRMAAALLAITAAGVAGCGSDSNSSDVNKAIDSVQSQANSVQSQISTAVTSVQQQAQSVQSQIQSVQTQIQNQNQNQNGGG